MSAPLKPDLKRRHPRRKLMALGLNDVDVDGMKEMDRKIRENPALGKRTVKVRSTWQRGVKALVEIGAQEVLGQGGDAPDAALLRHDGRARRAGRRGRGGDRRRDAWWPPSRAASPPASPPTPRCSTCPSTPSASRWRPTSTSAGCSATTSPCAAASATSATPSPSRARRPRSRSGGARRRSTASRRSATPSRSR